ncbi:MULTISPECIES: intermembrane transport protein PqiB [unclassified Neptuniibacter]|uniref:intermembrane transport protein PqiB n=1 Tax=unclassified Neptuniibacter TaxID=2630693 RepID=UPI000C45C0B0|nr:MULTISPECIES: intermembrane transport protein PqiB [unclassified Neptuniibacter]MAY43236.1 paraquat-inducible protein B [Oceanospirillaceae bacterium]|tara:strand:+ start:17118 stop:18785 length:1668 start_codon:yes stop_codon:yes gene_type:complete
MTPNENSAAQPMIKEKRSISSIWVLPLIALCIGGWMVYQDWANRGKLITISFITADGIEAGKTKIKIRNVEVGKVESVQLNYSENNVLVQARIEPGAEELLLENAKFWVVRPRVGAAGVSGLGTLLSGAYIEMAPGDNDNKRLSSRPLDVYTGLEEPPVTSATEPGLRLELVSDNAHSLSVGVTVLYKGFPVGRIERVHFDPLARQAVYGVFIKSPYDQLVSADSRFWNMSGINLDLSANGVNVQTGTFDTLFSGGITFDIPSGGRQGEAAKDGDRFRLYADFNSVKERPYSYYNEYLLLFDQSVRGLVAGAPVEFRGVRIGTVEHISFQIANLTHAEDPRVPVIIRLEPGRLGYNDEESILKDAHQKLNDWVNRGMRASLKSGNLITGSLFVDFDLYPDAQQQPLTQQEGYSIIPTVSGGFVQLENKLISVLSKIESLQIEPVIGRVDDTLKSSEAAINQLNTTLKQIEKLAKSKETQALPEELIATLREVRLATQGISPDSQFYIALTDTLQTLQQTLKQLQPVLKTLDNKSNALIFDAKKGPDLIPGEPNEN